MMTIKTILSIVFLHFFIFGFQQLPQLKWSIPNNTGFYPQIEAFQPKQIISTNTKSILIFDVDSGKVIQTIGGFTHIYGISKTHSNGYIVTDSNRIVILSSNYQIVRSIPVPANGNVFLCSAKEVSTGGYIALVDLRELKIVKLMRLNGQGDTLWTRIIDENAISERAFYSGLGVVETNGVFIACGTFCPGACLGFPGWIAAYTADGNEMWIRKRPGYSIRDLGTVDNGAIFTGQTERSTSFVDLLDTTALKKRSWFPATEVILLHLNADGEIVVDTTYDFELCDIGGRIRKSGNVFIISGYAGVYEFMSGPKNGFVMASDSSGKILWKKIYTSNSENGTSATALPLSWGGLLVSTVDSIHYFVDESDIVNPRKKLHHQTNLILNSTTNQITCILKEPASISYKLFSLSGQILESVSNKKQPEGSCTIPLRLHRSGTYIFELQPGLQSPLLRQLIIKR